MDGSGNFVYLHINECCSSLVLLLFSGSKMQSIRQTCFAIKADILLPLDKQCHECFPHNRVQASRSCCVNCRVVWQEGPGPGVSQLTGF